MSALEHVPSIAHRAQPPHGRFVRIFLGNLEARVMLVILLGMLALTAVPTGWLPHDPTVANLIDRFIPPAWLPGGSWEHVLGTDQLGRDVLSRIVFSARYTFLVSGVATVVATVFGVVAGMVAGLRGGVADAIIMRVVDVFLVFPVILLALALVVALGPSLLNLILVLALSAWAGYARIIRGAVLSLRGLEFITASRALGATELRLFSHLLLNLVSPILVLSTFEVARFILTESAISFLGLGIAPPAATWGGLLGDGRRYLYQAWWTTAFPGLAIALTVMSLNFLGDGMRDALDPLSAKRS